MMIDDLLYFGYNPSCGRSGLFSDLEDTASKEMHAETYGKLIEMGQNALKGAVDGELQRIGADSIHTVPLSSGLDSRSILGSLLKHPDIESKQIRTVSFGTPGTWDYEIGQQVADIAGVDNVAINLTASSFDWSVEQLRAYARTRECPVPMFEGYVNASAVKNFKRDGVVWSGFMGGETAGAHQPIQPSSNWDTAQEWFIENNRATDYFMDSQYDPTSTLPNQPYLERNKISYEEQLDFAHRQQCFIAPVVLFQPDSCATPFTHSKWLSFSLNLPHQHRRNRGLFCDMVSQSFPRLFSLPTDANQGLPLNASPVKTYVRSLNLRIREEINRFLNGCYTSPNTNYVNFDYSFRQHGQLANTAETLITALDRRNILPRVDGQELWRRHQSGENFAREIRIACSLELFYGSRER